MQNRARLRARAGHYALTTAATAAAVTLLLIAGPGAQGGTQAPATAGAAPAAPQGATPAAPGRGGAGGVYPEYVPDDDDGFVPIFDGKTLTGWDGDTTFWRAENGEIIGESTAEKVVKANSFLIWRAGTVRDFELKTEFRISGTNSGIQYRSVELPDVGKWVLKGYQADIDFAGEYLGNVHEERGRKPGHVVLAKRGMLTRISAGPKYKTLATIADGTLLKGVVNINGWNKYHIIARGPVMMQIINGQLVAATIDEDTKNFVPEGLLGFQMHVGPSFKVEYRNILYKKLGQ
jgi:hypothetical protein